MNLVRSLLLLLFVLFYGCASSQGLAIQPLHEVLGQEESRFFGGQSFAATAPPATIVHSPALGLYFKPTGFLNRLFEWTDHDRTKALKWASSVEPNPESRQHGLVPQSSIKGDTFQELRASASRYGYDLLLIFDGAAAVDRYNNYKGPLLYWTIVGAYVADGTHSEALCLIKGSVWDVKTGALLFVEEAEGRAQTVGPAAYVEDEAVILDAKQHALAGLLQKMEQRLPAPRGGRREP